MSLTSAVEWDCPIPCVKEGLGVPYLTYGGGRVGVSVSRWGGLHQIAYYGIAPESASSIYFEADAASSYARLFRFQLCIDGLPYNLELHDTRHFPFGYASHFAVEELQVEVRHHLTLLNDTVLSTLDVLKNPNNLSLNLQFEHHDSTQKAGSSEVVRQWSAWETDRASQALMLTASERWTEAGWQRELSHMQETPGQVGLATRTAGVREGETRIALFSELPLAVNRAQGRMQVSSQPFVQGTQALVLLFASDSETLSRRMNNIKQNLSSLARDKEAQYLRRLESVPTLSAANPVLSSYFANAPGISETLIVEDRPGAMRASSMHYWVWGWDTVMCSDAYLISGNSAFVRDALCFYRETADKSSGWAHQFSRDLCTRIPQAPSAQCLYLIMLYGYQSYTGDRTLLRDVYPFAQEIFQRACESLNSAGLGTGPALWPDIPDFAGHTGQDCSVFNNSILYQGARSMEALAHLCGDSETAERARKLGRGLEEKFVPTFWDKEKNYFVDSVDSVTLEQRKSYPSHALLWQSPFCSDLVYEKLPECAAFVRENHATPRGFLPYPRWDKAFNGDHNQLGQTWPITDVFDTMCMAAAGDQQILTQWIDEIAWFWEQLTVPEAYSVQTINDSGTPDAPGGKQPFSAKSWYMAIIQSLVGVSVDLGGLTLGPGLEEAAEIQRFHYQGSLIQISTEGAGKYPALLTVDGMTIQGSCKVPRSLLTEPSADHRIVYQRTTTLPAHPVILSLHGAALQSVEISADNLLRAKIAGSHDVWLHFSAPWKPQILLNGKQMAVIYDSDLQEGKALLPLRELYPTRLEIYPSC